MKTVAFCEIDPFCRRVLAKHWPEVPCYDDVITLCGARLRWDGIRPNVICGGFPCQDISVAGKGAGITGERSGLWSEFARLIGEIRPSYAIVENVAALLYRGLGDVLGDLAALGYDAEWHCIPASAIGAPHVRDRVWIIANPVSEGLSRHKFYWKGLRFPKGKAPTKFGDRSIHCGILWRGLGSYLRVVDGISREVDAIRSLGNTIVPQIPELIGKTIIEHATTAS